MYLSFLFFLNENHSTLSTTCSLGQKCQVETSLKNMQKTKIHGSLGVLSVRGSFLLPLSFPSL